MRCRRRSIGEHARILQRPPHFLHVYSGCTDAQLGTLAGGRTQGGLCRVRGLLAPGDARLLRALAGAPIGCCIYDPSLGNKKLHVRAQTTEHAVREPWALCRSGVKYTRGTELVPREPHEHTVKAARRLGDVLPCTGRHTRARQRRACPTGRKERRRARGVQPSSLWWADKKVAYGR